MSSGSAGAANREADRGSSWALTHRPLSKAHSSSCPHTEGPKLCCSTSKPNPAGADLWAQRWTHTHEQTQTWNHVGRMGLGRD